MGLPLIVRCAFDMRRERLFEAIEGHVLFLFLFLLHLGLSLLDLNLVDNVQRTPVISLQVRPSQHEDCALLLNALEERISDLANHLLLHNALQVVRYLFPQSHALLSSAHQVLDLLEIVFRAIVLELFHHLHVGAAIVLPDMLNKVSSVTNWLTLEREDERTVALVESIRPANLKTSNGC